GVREHFRRVPQQEEWAAGERGRHVAQPHPALRPPPQELDLVRREMYGPDDRGSAVVFLEPLVDNQPAVPEILGHWRARVRRGVLDVGTVHVFSGEFKIGFDRLAGVAGASDYEAADYNHPVPMQMVDGLKRR